MGGLAFVAVDTILPPMIQSLGGADWIVALAPTLLHTCFFLPGLFAAPLIERLPRLFPFVVSFGVLQRLPYLVAALMLALAGDSRPELVLWVVVMTPVVSGLSGGMAIPAWMELVTRLVPEHRRASAWAYRFIVGTLVGTLVGFSIERILTLHPGATGYAILHGAAFALVMLSLAFFSQLRETEIVEPPPRERAWYRQQFRIFGDILRTPSEFRRMLFARVLGTGFMILIPYLSITALEVSGRPESDLGRFVVAQMIGALVGNFLGGWLGDKVGGKAVLLTAKGVQLLLCLILAFNSTYAGFIAAFFLFGMAWFLMQVGENTLGIELAPKQRRPPYLVLLNLSYIPGALFASFTAWQLHSHFSTFLPLSAAAAVLVTGSAFLLLSIREPRSQLELL